MNPILRTTIVFFFLMVVFRLAGKRSLAQITSFDFVLILIIGEATQNALIGQDYSLTNSALVIMTLVMLDITLSLVKARFPRVERYLDDLPLVVVEDGRALRDRMRQARVDEDDVLAAARELQGLERLDQVKYAVLERSGGITVIPKSSAR
jgi:uncharacterized membrane protein YcaP (DUF421 family)